MVGVTGIEPDPYDVNVCSPAELHAPRIFIKHHKVWRTKPQVTTRYICTMRRRLSSFFRVIIIRPSELIIQPLYTKPRPPPKQWFFVTGDALLIAMRNVAG